MASLCRRYSSRSGDVRASIAAAAALSLCPLFLRAASSSSSSSSSFSSSSSASNTSFDAARRGKGESARLTPAAAAWAGASVLAASSASVEPLTRRLYQPSPLRSSRAKQESVQREVAGDRSAVFDGLLEWHSTAQSFRDAVEAASALGQASEPEVHWDWSRRRGTRA